MECSRYNKRILFGNLCDRCKGNDNVDVLMILREYAHWLRNNKRA